MGTTLDPSIITGQLQQQAAQPDALSQSVAALGAGANRGARLSPMMQMQPNALTGTAQ